MHLQVAKDAEGRADSQRGVFAIDASSTREHTSRSHFRALQRSLSFPARNFAPNEK